LGFGKAVAEVPGVDHVLGAGGAGLGPAIGGVAFVVVGKFKVAGGGREVGGGGHLVVGAGGVAGGVTVAGGVAGDEVGLRHAHGSPL